MHQVSPVRPIVKVFLAVGSPDSKCIAVVGIEITVGLLTLARKLKRQPCIPLKLKPVIVSGTLPIIILSSGNFVVPLTFRVFQVTGIYGCTELGTVGIDFVRFFFVN